MTARNGSSGPAIRAALEQVAQYGVPAPEYAELLDVGTGPFLTFFEREVIDGLVAQGGATCRFFQGAYGEGKTHLLTLIQERSLNRGMAVVRADLSQALSLHDWRLITRFVLENVEVRIADSPVRSIPAVLSHIGEADLADEARLRGATLPHPGVKNAMLRALEGPAIGDGPWELLRRYLLGERVGAGELRAAGITGVKNPLSQRNAEQVLHTVVGGLCALGVPGTILLFDENERTLMSRTRIPSLPTRRAANLMRRLIDACTTGGLTGALAIFAVLPGFLEASAEAYPALGQRLQVVSRRSYEPAWRWPVLQIDAIGAASSPEDFLSTAIDNMQRIVDACSGQVNGMASAMREEGAKVLEANAGPGYRRALMKLLTLLALDRIPRSAQ